MPHPINFPAAHRKPSHQQTAKKLTRRRSVNENSCCFESLLVLGFGHCLGLGLGLGIGGVGLGRGGKRRGGKLRGSRSRRQASRRQALRRQVEEAGHQEGPGSPQAAQQTAKKLTRRRSVNENLCFFDGVLVLCFGLCLCLGLGIGGVGLGLGPCLGLGLGGLWRLLAAFGGLWWLLVASGGFW